MPNPIVVGLIDVDDTLLLNNYVVADLNENMSIKEVKEEYQKVISGSQLNYLLIHYLNEKNIKDLYLFTDMKLSRITDIIERIVLIEELQKQGFVVHGVIIPSDCSWSQGNVDVMMKMEKFLSLDNSNPLLDEALKLLLNRNNVGLTDELIENIESLPSYQELHSILSDHNLQQPNACPTLIFSKAQQIVQSYFDSELTLNQAQNQYAHKTIITETFITKQFTDLRSYLHKFEHPKAEMLIYFNDRLFRHFVVMNYSCYSTTDTYDIKIVVIDDRVDVLKSIIQVPQRPNWPAMFSVEARRVTREDQGSILFAENRCDQNSQSILSSSTTASSLSFSNSEGKIESYAISESITYHTNDELIKGPSPQTALSAFIDSNNFSCFTDIITAKQSFEKPAPSLWFWGGAKSPVIFKITFQCNSDFTNGMIVTHDQILTATFVTTYPEDIESLVHDDTQSERLLSVVKNSNQRYQNMHAQPIEESDSNSSSMSSMSSYRPSNTKKSRIVGLGRADNFVRELTGLPYLAIIEKIRDFAEQGRATGNYDNNGEDDKSFKVILCEELMEHYGSPEQKTTFKQKLETRAVAITKEDLLTTLGYAGLPKSTLAISAAQSSVASIAR